MHVIVCVARYVSHRGPQARMSPGTPTAGCSAAKRAPRAPQPSDKLDKHKKFYAPHPTAPACGHLGSQTAKLEDRGKILGLTNLSQNLDH